MLANRAGGEIEDKITNSTPSAQMPSILLTNVTLDGNGAGTDAAGAPSADANPGNGGGLHVSGPGYVLVNSGTVSGNFAAREGGGLWNNAAPSTLGVSGTTFDANTALGSDSENPVGGGALFNKGGVITLDLDTSITGNTPLGVSGSGGGLSNDAGRIIAGGSTINGNPANRA